MISSLLVINQEPIAIVVKTQRGTVSSELIAEVSHVIRDKPSNSQLIPLVSTPQHTVCYRQSGEVWLVAVVQGDGPALLFTSILGQIEDILHKYIEKPLTDFGVKDNFAMIYRLLDIFMDSGYPLIDDYNGMLQFIPSPVEQSKDRGTINLIQPWRANGLTNSKQTIYIDVIEQLDNMYSLTTTKTSLSQLRGQIKVHASVNGNPRVSFGWKNAPMFEDIAFHRCVDAQIYNTQKRLDFVPPHGEFVLAEYRIPQNNVQLPIDFKANVVPLKGKLDISLSVSAATPPKTPLKNIVVRFKVLNPDSNTLQTKNGKVTLMGDDFVWEIGDLSPGKGAAELKGAVNCDDSCRSTVFRLQFLVDLSNAFSTFDIGTLQFSQTDSTEKDIYVGVKYQLVAGRYQVRAGVV